MGEGKLGRRELLLTAAGMVGGQAVLGNGLPGLRAASARQGNRLTIQEVIDRIVRDSAGSPLDASVDTVKVGDTSQPIKGITTTFMATREVLEATVAKGANLILTHEPTFYNHRDEREGLLDDPVYTSKLEYLESHKLVVWRFHDYIHMLRPDPMANGLAGDIGLQGKALNEEASHWEIAPIELQALALQCKKNLGLPSVRVVGDPAMKCRRIGLLPGAWGAEFHLKMLKSGSIDTLIIGEANEWETPEYVRDSSRLEHPFGLIVLGHQPSEEIGMQWLVQWLRPRFPDVPVEHISAKSPFLEL